MSNKPITLGPLATAAATLEAELLRFEAAAGTAMRVPLDSQRNLDKAARATNEAVEAQTRIGEHIQTFMAVLNTAREKNQVTSEGLRVRGLEIQARSDELNGVLARFNEIGRRAAETSEAVRVLGEAGAGSSPPEVLLGHLKEIEQRMQLIADDAQLVAKEAAQVGLDDLGKQATSLRQQVQSARNKVLLLQGQLGKRAT